LVAAAALAHAEEPMLLASGSAGSALEAAKQLLRYLADGNIEEAARLSNAPQRRYELLRDYARRSARRSSSACSASTSTRKTGWSPIPARQPPAADLGPRREAHHLAGQYYVEIEEGKF